MKGAKFGRMAWIVTLTILGSALQATAAQATAAETDLARKAQTILRTNCYRCHGQEGAVEGGMNFILDRDKLVARKKIIPGHADDSPLIRKVASGKMPPPGQQPRPSDADVAVLKQWIESGAANPNGTGADRRLISEAEVFTLILADLETIDKRSRRFTRYFTLTQLYNAGLSEDELHTYRNALGKLVNSLSWHPRITLPKPIDPAGIVLRIDLRDYLWDANLWNRILVEYPYGILQDTATARACAVAAATRMPFVRADWFVATASRPPLYQDMLQLPTTLPELERQLRVDAAVDIQQERVARAGFNGSGIAKNNRLLERHDAIHGAYWRTYDFNEVPQNLIERDNLLPDRRNLFAHPLGPGFTEESFQHAGGEAIWNLPNGLQAYIIVNANNQRLDKAPTAIVSDPKRPDRAVETGISCMGCHYAGINQKSDQIREHVLKNPKAFSRKDTELILALYPPDARMKALMDEDTERFRKAVEKTGGKISVFEPIMTMTLRYEADVDLPTAAAECDLPPAEFLARLSRSELLTRNLGALQVAGGTVQRQVWLQGFGDVVREMGLGILLQPTLSGQTLPDNTGEIDPLEGQSSLANSMAFAPDGRLALFASADKSVRLWDVEAGRDLRRFIGHTASVWSVAFSPDGHLALSGGADNILRLWDVETGRELRRYEGHNGLITCVAFSPDGRKAISGSYDQSVRLWDLAAGTELRTFEGQAKYINAVAFAPQGDMAVIAAERVILFWDLNSGKEVGRFEGHADSVTSVAFSADGKRLVSGSDDGTVRLWDVAKRQEIRAYSGHTGPVKSVVFSADGTRLLSGGSDHSVRLWDTEKGQELRRFDKHADTVITVAFVSSGTQTLSGSRDSVIRVWTLSKNVPPIDPKYTPGTGDTTPDTPVKSTLQPAATIPTGGTVSGLQISPNHKWLWYLNLAEGKLERINTATLKRDRTLALAEGTEAICLTPDGKTLYAAARAKADGGKGKIQVIDPLKMEVRKTITVAADPYDVAATDSGLVLVSGGGGDWTDVAVVDANKETLVTRWGGVWTRSFVQLAPEQNRLYLSTQGVTPGTASALLFPEKLGDKPVSHVSAIGKEHPLGGEFILSPDGKYLLCKTGTVLRLGAGRDEDLQYAATVEPFLAAVVDPEQHAALVLTPGGWLKHYAYPEFRLQGSYQLGVVAYQAVFDGKQGRLFAAVFDPRALNERPRGQATGEIFVYDLKDLLHGKAKAAMPKSD